MSVLRHYGGRESLRREIKATYVNVRNSYIRSIAGDIYIYLYNSLYIYIYSEIGAINAPTELPATLARLLGVFAARAPGAPNVAARQTRKTRGNIAGAEETAESPGWLVVDLPL